ncbi:MAG: hypothetical protein JO051_03620 [Acidobacteriaceae bacterium]|nr:hypothetical protein [Acidobacteriaceae bacterium]
MRIGLFSSFVILFALLVASSPRAVSQGASAPAKLQVHLNYTGSGTVDEKHKIYVALWDSADFMSGQAMPVEIQSSADKRGTVTFSDVQKVPAYASAVYDPTGEWDGQSGPPPQGSSLGLYSKTPGKPEPIDIKPGTTATVELSFDDRVKMQ